ncbi:6-O-methylguanine DNA methyltransferase [Shewanella sediminis HAW-EB3]|uniref:6-O-methylguanine DNA methyltransferase n=1 Tax=Shewanella sediminis (strain HAW-EB3) TaxID=425104 RepID=A8FYH5_SHESH|nr:class I SAM-dependent methyltransferase [Shewanella sediminis]ABV37898.1 6-O-methylguanine DNA methyltransferase [Shewanella sediminis HAW-EB3]
MKEVIGTQKSSLAKQKSHWETTLSSKPDMFGELQSACASIAVDLFKKEGVSDILELGGGQGRDTMFFAKSGFQVQVIDYSPSGVVEIKEKAASLGLSHLITAKCHDIRNPLPFKNDSLDACYSHMLYCMALTTSELEFLSKEVRRVLKPGGLNIYTVRHTGDADYAVGTHHGEDMYQAGGFIVHFFSEDKVRHLAEGFKIVEIDEFEEGALPRKLFRVTLRKE